MMSSLTIFGYWGAYFWITFIKSLTFRTLLVFHFIDETYHKTVILEVEEHVQSTCIWITKQTLWISVCLLCVLPFKDHTLLQHFHVSMGLRESCRNEWSFTIFHFVFVSLVSWDQPSQLCPLPSSCSVSACWPLGKRGVSERQEAAWMLWEHCWAIADTLVCSQHCFSHRCKAQRHMGCHEES